MGGSVDQGVGEAFRELESDPLNHARILRSLSWLARLGQPYEGQLSGDQLCVLLASAVPGLSERERRVRASLLEHLRVLPPCPDLVRPVHSCETWEELWDRLLGWQQHAAYDFERQRYLKALLGYGLPSCFEPYLQVFDGDFIEDCRGHIERIEAHCRQPGDRAYLFRAFTWFSHFIERVVTERDRLILEALTRYAVVALLDDSVVDEDEPGALVTGESYQLAHGGRVFTVLDNGSTNFSGEWLNHDEAVRRLVIDGAEYLNRAKPFSPAQCFDLVVAGLQAWIVDPGHSLAISEAERDIADWVMTVTSPEAREE